MQSRLSWQRWRRGLVTEAKMNRWCHVNATAANCAHDVVTIFVTCHKFYYLSHGEVEWRSCNSIRPVGAYGFGYTTTQATSVMHTELHHHHEFVSIYNVDVVAWLMSMILLRLHHCQYMFSVARATVRLLRRRNVMHNKNHCLSQGLVVHFRVKAIWPSVLTLWLVSYSSSFIVILFPPELRRSRRIAHCSSAVIDSIHNNIVSEKPKEASGILGS